MRELLYPILDITVEVAAECISLSHESLDWRVRESRRTKRIQHFTLVGWLIVFFSSATSHNWRRVLAAASISTEESAQFDL